MYGKEVKTVKTFKYLGSLFDAKMKEDVARTQKRTETAEERKHWHVIIHAGTRCGTARIKKRIHIKHVRKTECVNLLMTIHDTWSCDNPKLLRPA